MDLIRFEFRGDGIFHALKLLDEIDMLPQDEQDLYDAYVHLSEFLPVPDVLNECNVKTKSFFTKKGYEVFREQIEAICYYLVEYLGSGLCVVHRTSSDFRESDVVYEDEFQVVVCHGAEAINAF